MPAVSTQEDRYRLHDALEEVLIQNKEEFVRLFLEIGANLKTFLNEHRLLVLYEKVSLYIIFTYSSKMMDDYDRV